MIRRHLLGLGIVIVALLATLGHVCVLPIGTHAEQSEADHHDGDAFHAASCEALRTAPSSIPKANAVAFEIVPVAPEGVRSVGLIRAMDRTPIVRGSPPLYLRHAALLI
jgi:hypothetical protein